MHTINCTNPYDFISFHHFPINLTTDRFHSFDFRLVFVRIYLFSSFNFCFNDKNVSWLIFSSIPLTFISQSTRSVESTSNHSLFAVSLSIAQHRHYYFKAITIYIFSYWTPSIFRQFTDKLTVWHQDSLSIYFRYFNQGCRINHQSKSG